MKFFVFFTIIFSRLVLAKCPDSSPVDFPILPSIYTKVILVPGAGSESDDLNLGYIPYGKYFSIYIQELKRIGVPFEVMASSPSGNEDIESRARQLRSLLKKQTVAILLIGHSLGGLVARVAQRDPEAAERVAATVSISTPHSGTPVADWLVSGESLPRSASLIARAFGFDVHEKKYLEQLTVVNKNRWDTKQDHAPHLKNMFSVVGAQTSKELTLTNPLFALGDQIVRGYDPHLEADRESDGLVPLQSQIWGECLLFVEKNHGSIIGKDFFSTPSRDVLPKILINLRKRNINFKKEL